MALFLALALLTAACSGDAQPAGDSSGAGLRAEPTPAAQSRPTRAPTSTPQPPGQPGSSAGVADYDRLGNLPSIPLSTDRVIVRRVDLTLVVKEVTRSITRISEVATSFGGWVVSSTQDQPHVG